uniref:Phosphatidic acid phosphatase type 2/haloperoxidase domain-containing protein n=1 Tax=Amphiprion ocellaris TaxID=80972 RepID=A0AAQ5ZPS0_AMPOC
MKDLRKRKLFVLMDVLCVLVAALPFIIMTIVFKPYQRGIYCDDESIKYPVKPDTITHGMLAAVTISCTVIIISSGEAYLVYSKRIYSNSDFNQYVAALYKVVGTFLFGAAVSQSLTDLAKFTIGRPRPNFMSVCSPKVCTGYMQVINCTGKPQDVTESSFMCRRDWRLSGPDSSDPPSSSSWWPSRCTWVTPESLITSTTGATCWWGCCRERLLPYSMCASCRISLRSVLHVARGQTQPIARSRRGSPAFRLQTRSTATITTTTTLLALCDSRTDALGLKGLQTLKPV